MVALEAASSGQSRSHAGSESCSGKVSHIVKSPAFINDSKSLPPILPVSFFYWIFILLRLRLEINAVSATRNPWFASTHRSSSAGVCVGWLRRWTQLWENPRADDDLNPLLSSTQTPSLSSHLNAKKTPLWGIYTRFNMTYDPQRGCGELQKWHGNVLRGKKRDQIRNSERLPLSWLFLKKLLWWDVGR